MLRSANFFSSMLLKEIRKARRLLCQYKAGVQALLTRNLQIRRHADWPLAHFNHMKPAEVPGLRHAQHCCRPFEHTLRTQLLAVAAAPEAAESASSGP
jgi:hypothetical protein